MNTPLINILTRTSNRPNYFKDCKNSIDIQTYKNINHLISIDNVETETYVKNLNYIKVKEYTKEELGYFPKEDLRFAPYNLYLNDLNKLVERGWIMYLDDDNMLIGKNAIKKLIGYTKDTDTLLLWKVKFSNNRLVPNDKMFGKEPVLGHIDMAGFMFHSKYKNKIKFDHYSCGDYRVIKNLWDIIPNKIWIDDIITGLQRLDATGGSGLRDDKTW